MARPLKLTDETSKLIVEALRTGNTRKDASESNGVAYATFIKWIHLGESGIKPYVQFLEQVNKAEAEARIACVNVIVQVAAKGDWRAAMEYLSRRDPENWSPQRKESTDNTSKIVINVDNDNDDDK